MEEVMIVGNEKLNIIGFAGSLRKASYNKFLLNACLELLPEEMNIEIFDLDGIPPFNQDFESDPPERVKVFKEKIRLSDGVLVATPEYNYSIPGVLKNAIDWASRPYGDNVFFGKPAAIIGASIGMLGTARAQYHLRQVFVCLNVYVLNQPEVMVPLAEKKFDKNGRLVDDSTRERLKDLLSTFSEWVSKFKV
ncbi:MAG: NAD(P)H-dependent oxidoreductase [Deltaproteobacteria bacterium]|nr:NAD(P)H-dependent oxidoreductase [Deltaproteobacteria bacterium]